MGVRAGLGWAGLIAGAAARRTRSHRPAHVWAPLSGCGVELVFGACLDLAGALAAACGFVWAGVSPLLCGLAGAAAVRGLFPGSRLDQYLMVLGVVLVDRLPGPCWGALGSWWPAGVALAPRLLLPTQGCGCVWHLCGALPCVLSAAWCFACVSGVACCVFRERGLCRLCGDGG